MLLSVLKEGASSLCLIASLVSTQGIQTTILSDLLHSSSQAQIQLGPSLGIDLLYSPFPSTKSNYPLTPHLQKSHTTVQLHIVITMCRKISFNYKYFQPEKKGGGIFQIHSTIRGGRGLAPYPPYIGLLMQTLSRVGKSRFQDQRYTIKFHKKNSNIP